MHPDKTHVGDCRQPGEGFDFLGYRFEAGQRQVRKKSLQSFKERMRAKTRRRVRAWQVRWPTSTQCSRAGLPTSSTRTNIRSASLMGKSAVVCARCCASRKSIPASAVACMTINAGQMPSSRKSACSPCTQAGSLRDNPDEETTNWRAVCGKTARTVRRGEARAFPTPIVLIVVARVSLSAEPASNTPAPHTSPSARR